jgi:hypothetical protein
MIRYYVWALGEKALSLTPGGKAFYRAVGRIARHRTQGTGGQLANSYPIARKARELVPPGGTVLDLGTGWFHHDAFLLYLVGDWTVFLFDIEDRGRLRYIRNYLGYLLDNVGAVSRELGIDESEAAAKLRELLALGSREEIYARCNFVLCITDQVERPFLPEGSIDFMVSNCVLVHIRPHQLPAELVALRKMLNDGGAMYHMLGHDDHWAFHDPSVKWPSFNYLRYSERAYRALFDTRLEYHNRIVKPEWLEIFGRAGLRVDDYEAVVTDDSRESVRSLPRIDSRYASYPIDDLAVIYSYVLLRKQAPDGNAEADPGRVAAASS